MSGQSKKPVLTPRYDLAGNSLLRQVRHWIRTKTSIMGNYAAGPGLRCLLALGLLHYVGKPLFRIRVWLNNQYTLKARVRKAVSRLRK